MHNNGSNREVTVRGRWGRDRQEKRRLLMVSESSSSLPQWLDHACVWNLFSSVMKSLAISACGHFLTSYILEMFEPRWVYKVCHLFSPVPSCALVDRLTDRVRRLQFHSAWLIALKILLQYLNLSFSIKNHHHKYMPISVKVGGCKKIIKF